MDSDRARSGFGLGLGATEDWAVELLKTAAPSGSAVGRKQRVWMGLTYATERSVGMGGARWFRRLVVTAVVLVLGLGTAIASAALGHWPKWAVRAYESLVTSPQASAPPPLPKTPPSRYRHRAGGSHLPPATVAEFEPDCLDDVPAEVETATPADFLQFEALPDRPALHRREGAGDLGAVCPDRALRERRRSRERMLRGRLRARRARPLAAWGGGLAPDQLPP